MPRFSALMAALFTAGLALSATAQPQPRPPKPAPAAAKPAAPGAAKPAPGAAKSAPGAAKPASPAAKGAATPASPKSIAAELHAKAIRAKILRQRVGLSEERAVKVEAVLERYAPERRRIEADIRDATKILRELMRANSEDQQAYGRALDRLRAGQKALQSVRDREQEGVRQLLKPREQALLLRSLENWRKRARAGGTA
jgi:hypothetical protein